MPNTQAQIETSTLGYLPAYLNDDKREIFRSPVPNYSTIIKDPTIALARQFAISTLSSINISTSLAADIDDEVNVFLLTKVIPLLQEQLPTIAADVIDHGFSTFEVTYKNDQDGYLPDYLHNLLPEFTKVVIERTGKFAGLSQRDINGQTIFLPKEDVWLFNINQRGDNYYGRSILDNATSTFMAYRILLSLIERYNNKLAGHNVIIYYPPDRPGTSTNKDAAYALASTWSATGILTAESREVAKYSNDIERVKAGSEVPGWSFEILESKGGTGASFEYFFEASHKLFCRAFLIPERSVLEGQHGTLAESVTHSNVVLSNYKPFAERLVKQFKLQVVDKLLKANFLGVDVSKVDLSVSFKPKDNWSLLQDLYKQLASNDVSNIDFEAIKYELGVPALAMTDESNENSANSNSGNQNEGQGNEMETNEETN